MKLSEKDLEKMMAFVMEHKDMISSMLKVINENTEAGTEHASDGINNTESMDGEGTEAIISEECEDDDDEEKVEIEISEGDAEKAGTEGTSDGVDYPDVGDGTGVEGETLHEEDECEEDEVEELNEEGGTASAPAPGGAAAPVGGGVGSNTANTGIARVKAPLGKKVNDKGSNVTRRYDENARVETADDVKAMMESWKNKGGWQGLYF